MLAVPPLYCLFCIYLSLYKVCLTSGDFFFCHNLQSTQYLLLHRELSRICRNQPITHSDSPVSTRLQFPAHPPSPSLPPFLFLPTSGLTYPFSPPAFLKDYPGPPTWGFPEPREFCGCRPEWNVVQSRPKVLYQWRGGGQ